MIRSLKLRLSVTWCLRRMAIKIHQGTKTLTTHDLATKNVQGALSSNLFNSQKIPSSKGVKDSQILCDQKYYSRFYFEVEAKI